MKEGYGGPAALFRSVVPLPVPALRTIHPEAYAPFGEEVGEGARVLAQVAAQPPNDGSHGTRAG